MKWEKLVLIRSNSIKIKYQQHLTVKKWFKELGWKSSKRKYILYGKSVYVSYFSYRSITFTDENIFKNKKKNRTTFKTICFAKIISWNLYSVEVLVAWSHYCIVQSQAGPYCRCHSHNVKLSSNQNNGILQKSYRMGMQGVAVTKCCYCHCVGIHWTCILHVKGTEGGGDSAGKATSRRTSDKELVESKEDDVSTYPFL